MAAVLRLVFHALLITVTALALSGCGGGEESAPTTTQTTARDPGREVMGAFVAAAAAGNNEAMWDLLSQPSRRRTGPTVEAFAKSEARRLQAQLAPFAGGTLPVEVSERVAGSPFGVVALVRGAKAFAVPLRLEANFWRVELPGPVRIEVLGPPPGSRGKFVNQVGVEVHGRGPGLYALYVDGITLDTKGASGPTSATVFANFASSLERGRHAAVAFATRGENAAARAWTFVV
jgi:hypothetical protein